MSTTIMAKANEEVSADAGPSRIRSFHAKGKASLRSVQMESASWCTFAELEFTFPLRLMSPRESSLQAVDRIKQYRNEEPLLWNRKGKGRADDQEGVDQIRPVGVLYVVGFGGGLVSGDRVEVDFDVGCGSTLLLLTQGTTKVFKIRRPIPPPPAPAVQPPSLAGDRASQDTLQYFRFIVRENSTLVLLPDAVTCFEDARYEQVQRVDVRCRRTSSLILLDWYTPGRIYYCNSEEPNLAELWGFGMYKSRNEIRVQGKVVVRDSLLLEKEEHEQNRVTGDGTASSLAKRNAPYRCYATLFLLGPDFQDIIQELFDAYDQVQQGMRKVPPRFLWSFSILEEDLVEAGVSLRAAVLRIAAESADDVRNWLRVALHSMQAVIGDDLYKQAFGNA